MVKEKPEIGSIYIDIPMLKINAEFDTVSNQYSLSVKIKDLEHERINTSYEELNKLRNCLNLILGFEKLKAN